MSDLLSTVDRCALAQAQRASRQPRRKVFQDDVVFLSVLYDAFDPTSVEHHELQWRQGATLSEYLEGLPADCEWLVFHNTDEVDLTLAGDVTPARGDSIGLVVVPLGSGGLKTVLRVVMMAAMIALTVVAPELGLAWWAVAAIEVGLGLVNAFLLTPKPKTSSGDSSTSYGIDGAKNSATEGIPYPVIYGTFRFAGNFCDVYTQNVGDDQYLYVRTVINDGLVDSITDIEINEQPLAYFTDTESRVSLGGLDAQPNDWFLDSIVMNNQSVIIDTGWVSYQTHEPIDKLRFDVSFQSGLVNIDSKKGTYSNRSVTFEMQYRELDPITFQPISATWNGAAASPSTNPIDLNGDGTITVGEVGEVMAGALVGASAPASIVSNASSPAPSIEFQDVGASDWQTVGDFATNEEVGRGIPFDSSGDGSIAGASDITPMVSNSFSVSIPSGAGGGLLRASNGATITQVQTFPSAGSSTVTVTDNRTKQIRKTFETSQLDHGIYEVQIRRTTATSTDQYKVDEVYLTDIGEITMAQVALRGTANISLKVKLSDQLNAIPQLTGLVKGSLLQEYDINGNLTVQRWSANPAWIGLDILCGIERGVGYATSRIDWPSWLDLADWCDTNGIEFNGVFSDPTNAGDALNQVLAVAHAAPVPFGNKISVAIDRPRDPVGSFNQANIIEGTFAVTYLSMADRSNEFELSFYDRNDRNKEKTIRYVDPKAVTFNEVQRAATVTVPGIDNMAQATAALWRMIYTNRLVVRTVSFDAWLDAINLSLGETTLLQHDMMAWADSGKLAAGSTTTALNLDIPVVFETGKSYSALVHFDAVELGTVTVNTVAGNLVLVTGAIDPAAARFIVGNQDLAIVRVQTGTPYNTITLESAPGAIATGSVAQLWGTDVVVEKNVLSVAPSSDGKTSVVQLADALPAAPGQYANWVYGEVQNVKRPYALLGIDGSGLDRRTLTFIEYVDAIYGPPEVEIPIPTSFPSSRTVGQVQALLFDYESVVAANRTIINARVHWNAAGILNYAGADVFMSINGSAFRSAGSAVNVSELLVQIAPGDQVEFKVIAYNKHGDRAPFSMAPSVRGTINVTFASLDAPTNVTASTVAFDVNGKVQIAWNQPADPTGIADYEFQYRRTVDQSWTSKGYSNVSPVEIDGLSTGTYIARVRAASATSTSVWVEEPFTVVVAPGSLMANFSAGNDRNSDPVPAPTLPATNAVQHTLNTDGSANVVFEWIWGGDEATIDGFIITVDDTPPA